MINNNYNFLVKLLHYSIIGNKIIPELLFDVENFLFKKKNKSIEMNHQIYVTGLARAGTTILLNTIYDTKKFASFTYRDMPFVISPNIWNIVSKYLKSKKSIERKHNDKMMINLDSPEQFEEIFWNLKTSEKYIFKDHLRYHQIDNYNLDLYELFIKNCLVKYKKFNYLCKNNNSLLRIKSLINKFPKVDFKRHACGGTAQRKRGIFGKETDMIEAFKILKVNEIHLEHCSLHYTMLDVFKNWNFDGRISLGVIDQRIDNTETEEDIVNAIKPALEYFPKEKILLTSECGFGHVPIDIVRNKIKILVSTAKKL